MGKKGKKARKAAARAKKAAAKAAAERGPDPIYEDTLGDVQ